ncbi:unnamed protein product [Caretta caretta]
MGWRLREGFDPILISCTSAKYRADFLPQLPIIFRVTASHDKVTQPLIVIQKNIFPVFLFVVPILLPLE